MRKLPLLCITMGDPAGIGPEIIVKAHAGGGLAKIARTIVVGDARVMELALEKNKTAIALRRITEASDTAPGALNVLSLENVDIAKLVFGKIDPACGLAALEYVKRAVCLAVRGLVDAVVTAPVSKESINLAGTDFTGHTELIAEMTRTKNFAMMQSSGNLRVVFVSTHLPIADVAKHVTRRRLSTVSLSWSR